MPKTAHKLICVMLMIRTINDIICATGGAENRSIYRAPDSAKRGLYSEGIYVQKVLKLGEN